MIESVGEVEVERRLGVGGSGMIFQALKKGEIDLYVDYTGTISLNYLKQPQAKKFEDFRLAVEKMGFIVSNSLGSIIPTL